MGKKGGIRVSESSRRVESSIGSSFRKTRRKNGVSSLATATVVGTAELGKVDEHKTKHGIVQNIILHNGTMLSFIIGMTLAGFYVLFISQTLTNFPTLTNLEKELSLPTDTALRYSLFKRISGVNNKDNSASSSLRTRFRSIISDNRNNFLQVTNSLDVDGLLPETILATIFHLVKKVCNSRCGNNDNDPISSPSSFSSVIEWSDQICSGIGDPLSFYMAIYWVLDSLAVAGIVVAGTQMSDGSTMGGLFSGLVFILSHPHLGNWARIMFPNGDKIGVLVSSFHIFMISKLVMKPLHSCWTSVVKLALATAGLVMMWPMEAQWILIAEVCAVLTLNFYNVLSPYRVSIVVGSHIVGWEYASLMSMDFSLRHWTFYLYLGVGVVLVVYPLRMVVDKLFGPKKLEKWLFLRAIILCVGLYVCVSETRHGFIGLSSSLREDVRMSHHLRHYEGERRVKSEAVILSTHDESIVINEHKYDQLYPPPAHKHALPSHGESLSSDEIHSASKSSSSDPHENGQASKVDKILDRKEDEEKNESDYSTSTTTTTSQSADLHMNEEVLNEHLFQCLFSSMPSPMGRLVQLLLNHATPISLAFLGMVIYYGELRKLSIVVKVPSEQPGLTRSIQFHALCSIFFLILAALIHEKFAILSLIQVSLIASLFFFRVDAPLLKSRSNAPFFFGWTNITDGMLNKESHSRLILAILIVAMMMTTAKVKMNFPYESTHEFQSQGDTAEGKEELIQVIKWIRNQSLSSSASFLGPSSLMINVYCSGGNARIANFQEDEVLPYNSVLSHLFNPHLSLHQLCQTLNRTSSHLILSKDFCLNPVSPHINIAHSKDIPPETDQILGMKMHSKHHAQQLSNSNFEPVHPLISSCNLIEFWDELITRSKIEWDERGHIPCMRLFSEDTELEMKPFRRVFHNRLYSIVSCS